MPHHDTNLPDYREMCAPFLGILRVYGGPEDAAYMRDMYLPLGARPYNRRILLA